MTHVDRRPPDRVDVCVVGSGVAGALVAHSLARRGHEVVVLEAGPRFDPSDRLKRMEIALRPSHDRTDVWDDGGTRDTHDVENLSIASSSVFTTTGAVNPTLTIAALSLKAADHLHDDL